MWKFDPQFVADKCLLASNSIEEVTQRPLLPVIRCEALRNYRGDATESNSWLL